MRRSSSRACQSLRKSAKVEVLQPLVRCCVPAGRACSVVLSRYPECECCVLGSAWLVCDKSSGRGGKSAGWRSLQLFFICLQHVRPRACLPVSVSLVFFFCG